MGFPIVKHEDQCLTLFHLLEQDCIDVVREWKCDIVCFLETKLSSLDSPVVRSLWGMFLDWVAVDAVNIAGECY